MAPDEKTPLQDIEEEGFQKGLDTVMGGFICCRVLAPISAVWCEKRRHQLLYIGHFLCAIGAVMCCLAYAGAVAWGDTLSHLSWIRVHSPVGSGYAGVVWVCFENEDRYQGGITADPRFTHRYSFLQEEMDWKCESWREYHCEDKHSSACQKCKMNQIGIIFSGMVACFTYFSFYHHTDQRLIGNDSSFTKFRAVTSALIGSVNFMITTQLYWWSCVSAAETTGTTARAGTGLILMYIATVTKILMGVVHLGLKVEDGVDSARVV